MPVICFTADIELCRVDSAVMPLSICDLSQLLMNYTELSCDTSLSQLSSAVIPVPSLPACDEVCWGAVLSCDTCAISHSMWWSLWSCTHLWYLCYLSQHVMKFVELYHLCDSSCHNTWWILLSCSQLWYLCHFSQRLMKFVDELSSAVIPVLPLTACDEVCGVVSPVW